MRDVVLLLGSLLCTTRRIGIVHQESIYGSAHLIRSQYEHVQERGMQRRGSRTSAKDNKIACLNYRRSVPYYGIRAACCREAIVMPAAMHLLEMC